MIEGVDELLIAERSPAELEIAAMKTVGDAFDQLDPEAARRVLEWAKARYSGGDVLTMLTQMMKESFGAIAAHRDASSKQPRQADRALWEATIKDTGYWKEITDSELDRSSSGE